MIADVVAELDVESSILLGIAVIEGALAGN